MTIGSDDAKNGKKKSNSLCLEPQPVGAEVRRRHQHHVEHHLEDVVPEQQRGERRAPPPAEEQREVLPAVDAHAEQRDAEQQERDARAPRARTSLPVADPAAAGSRRSPTPAPSRRGTSTAFVSENPSATRRCAVWSVPPRDAGRPDSLRLIVTSVVSKIGTSSTRIGTAAAAGGQRARDSPATRREAGEQEARRTGCPNRRGRSTPGGGCR